MELTPYRDATERTMTRASFSDAATEHIGLEVRIVILHDLSTIQKIGLVETAVHRGMGGSVALAELRYFRNEHCGSHFGMCGQGCGCCRVNSTEPGGTCEVCDQLWLLKCTCQILKAHVQTYGETTYGPRAGEQRATPCGCSRCVHRYCTKIYLPRN